MTKLHLLEKSRPQQARAIQTYERILLAAATLLERLGVDAISTNNIAEHAGITVPALYRYFPNKYAVLYALGARLMDQQNQVFREWSDAHSHSQVAMMEHVLELLQETYRVTAKFKGSVVLMRALRALPVMQDVLLESHQAMSQWALANWPLAQNPDNLRRLRLTLQMATSAIEMALEDADMPAEFALAEACQMIQGYWRIHLTPPQC